MRNLLLAIALSLFSHNVLAEECPTSDLGVFLDHENPRTIAFIESLEGKERGYKIKGFRLCDGSILFEGWSYIGKANNLKRGQHVYIFKYAKAYRAVAWVEEKGIPLSIPSCPKHIDCSSEGQYALSFDIYTFKAIQPGDGPIILYFPWKRWLPA